MLARRVLGDTYSCGLVAQPGGSVGRAVTTSGSWPIRILARPFRPRQPANPEPGRGTSSHPTGFPLFHTSYDANGNLATQIAGGSATTYTWDGENRMRTATLPGGSVTTFTYAANGLRRKTEVGGTTKSFVWDHQDVLLETDGSGTTQAAYTQGRGGYGPLVAQRRSGVSSFYHADALGSTMALTDASQVATDAYRYLSFGQTNASTGSTTNPFGFVGRLGYYTEAALGLQYLRARWYQPGAGRFVSIDPTRRASTYGYVGGRPTWTTDPSGLMSDEEFDRLQAELSQEAQDYLRWRNDGRQALPQLLLHKADFIRRARALVAAMVERFRQGFGGLPMPYCVKAYTAYLDTSRRPGATAVSVPFDDVYRWFDRISTFGLPDVTHPIDALNAKLQIAFRQSPQDARVSVSGPRGNDTLYKMRCAALNPDLAALLGRVDLAGQVHWVTLPNHTIGAEVQYYFIGTRFDFDTPRKSFPIPCMCHGGWGYPLNVDTDWLNVLELLGGAVPFEIYTASAPRWKPWRP